MTNETPVLPDKINVTGKAPIIEIKNKPPFIKIGFKKFKVRLWHKILLGISVFLTLVYFVIIAVIYYQKNYSPKGKIDKSITNLVKAGTVNYNCNLKFTFMSSDKEEKIGAYDMEVYSLLKRSAADSFEVDLIGQHNWKTTPPEGNFNLIWSTSENKLFALDSNYRGYEMSYKITPYLYQDLVSQELKETYTKIDLYDLLGKILAEGYFNGLLNINYNNFKYTVLEVFPDDINEDVKTNHFKISIIPDERNEVIPEGVKFKDVDLWVVSKKPQIKRVKTEFEILSIGLDGNNLTTSSDCKFNN